MDFPEITFQLMKGDRIFLYTDGVNEAMGKEKEEFGFDRMLAVLDVHQKDSDEELCNAVKTAVDILSGTHRSLDDMTMLSITYWGG